MKIRLDKYLADAGFGTRNEVKALVRSGAVTINGEKTKDSSQKIDPDNDEVKMGGEGVDYSEYEYYMLNKPAGIITASRDKNEETVLNLIKSKKRRDLFPVGRLDRDTEGLLLITNDGELSHKLLSPGNHVEKGYVAIVTGKSPDDIETLFENGLDIGDEKLTKPAKLRRFSDLEEFMTEYDDSDFAEKFSKLQAEEKNTSDESDENKENTSDESEENKRNTSDKSDENKEKTSDEFDENKENTSDESEENKRNTSDKSDENKEKTLDKSDENKRNTSDESEENEKKIKPRDENLTIYEIKITEGRYHEIKRMFEAVGCSVVYLKRYSMGSLILDSKLKPGEYKKLKNDAMGTVPMASK